MFRWNVELQRHSARSVEFWNNVMVLFGHGSQLGPYVLKGHDDKQVQTSFEFDTKCMPEISRTLSPKESILDVIVTALYLAWN